MASMNNLTRRDLSAALASLAVVGAGLPEAFASQAHASEYPARESPQPPGRTVPAHDSPGVSSRPGVLDVARVFAFDQMPVRAMANGGESRDIVHGTVATGEAVNLHQSMQEAGAAPNPAHAIQHSEFILVWQGALEFSHEDQGRMMSERVGPGDAIYVAFGTRHALKNVGSVPARYFVIAIGGDVK